MASTLRERQREPREGGDSAGRAEDPLRLPAKKQAEEVKSRYIITEHIDVGVPAEEAFEQWTQYEKWSQMFKNESAGKDSRGSGSSRRKNEQVKVEAKIGPSRRQWTAEVVSSEPGRRINWRSKGPLKAIGSTSFSPLDDRLTHLSVAIEYRPTGLLETVGNFFRMQRRRVRRDLRLFKNYVELRRVADYSNEADAGKGTDGDEEEG